MTQRSPRNAINGRRADVAAVPNKPAERHAGICFAALPTIAMHHRQAFAENVHARQPAPLENPAAPLTLEERQPQQHDHERREFERVRDEFLGDLIGRIGQNALAAGRHSDLAEEVTVEVQRESVVCDVGGDRHMAVITKDVHDRAATGGRLPYARWDLLDAQQRFSRALRRFV
jgi:hypothetical protein